MKKIDDMYLECGKCGKEVSSVAPCPHCRYTGFNLRHRSKEEQKDKIEMEIYEKVKKREQEESHGQD